MAGVEKLREYLAPTLGDEKARDAVSNTVDSMGLNPMNLSKDEALNVLETLAGTDGIVGITARFAKSRVHLEW